MIITSLSASMVNTYRQCPYKFYCSYCLKLPRRSNAFLAFGSSFHRMCEENFYQKRTTYKDLPTGLLLDFFRDDLHYTDDVDWKEQEQTLAQTTDQGVATVRAFQDKVAPGIQPVEVEHLWSMEVNNRPWNITGKTDLLTAKGVEEIKTTNTLPAKPRDKSPPKPKPDHAFQVSTYAMGWKAQTGCSDVQGRLDYAKRGGEEVMSVNVELESAQSIVSTFDNVAMSVQREWWPIFRNHYLCSRKYCNFAEQCEKDCGGRVKE